MFEHLIEGVASTMGGYGMIYYDLCISREHDGWVRSDLL